jgi:hypothetical protein
MILIIVKTKRQANFKDFKQFGAFKGLVKQKNVLNSFVCQLGLFDTFDVLKRTRPKKPQFTQEFVK